MVCLNVSLRKKFKKLISKLAKIRGHSISQKNIPLLGNNGIQIEEFAKRLLSQKKKQTMSSSYN